MKKIILLFIFVTASCLPSQAQYTKLMDFTDIPTGKTPQSELISDGTFLYGTGYQGGANGFGTIYKIKPDGTGFVKLHDFDYTNGSYPFGGLIMVGPYLYGMAIQGGVNDFGIIYKIKPDGTGYATVYAFDYTTGASPYGSLFSDGTYLYGISYLGGTAGYGTIYRIKPDGTGFLKLHDFNVVAGDGKNPYGSLISDGTYLYGMTYLGGANNMGCGFKIKPDGTSYSKFLEFAGITNGGYPVGSFIYDGTYLYSTTGEGGINNMGVIFKVKPDGTSYSKLLDFAGTSNGDRPHANLVIDGAFMYGVTTQGGANNYGVIYKIKPDGTSFSKLYDFIYADGSNPNGTMISVGGALYGTTSASGANAFGTIYKYQYCSAVVGYTVSPSSTICTGSSVTLTGTGASTYTWTGGVSNGVSFVPGSTTTYTVTGTDISGCSNTTTATITVNPPPTVTLSALPAFVNINAANLTLSGTPAGGTYSGTGVSGNSFNPSVAGLGTAHITYSYSSGGCSGSGSRNTIVYDTTGTVCTTYTSVVDTLIIHATLTGISPPNNTNTVKIYPNPAADHIYINNGNYSSMAGYTIKIQNSLGQQVFLSAVNQALFYIDLSTWTGSGLYFVHIIDGLGNTIELKKIVVN